MKTRITLGILFSALTVGIASPQVPAGGEFQVNTLTTNIWVYGSVASAPNGNFVVVWSGLFPDFPATPASHGQERTPTNYGTNGRLYDASGALITEFQVRPGFGYVPRAAFGPGGAFVVVWQSYVAGSRGDIFARRYDARGVGGPELRVNTYTTGKQAWPSVSADGSGNFVVVWISYGQDGDGGVFARRYDASGTPRGAEFRANAYTTGGQANPVVAADAAGNFVVAWSSDDGGSTGVAGRRFDASGVPRGPDFRINTYTTGYQSPPAVASDPAGNFVVAWTGPDASGPAIFARRFDASGTALGAEFLVHSGGGADVRDPSAAYDAAGNFVVAWTVGSFGVLRRYDAAGAPRGSPFTALYGYRSSAASDSAGNVVVAARRGYGFRDSAIFGQRIGGIVAAAAVVDGAPSSGSDGNRVLEPGESVGVEPSWRNVNGAAQTFNGTIIGFTGPTASGVSYAVLDAFGTYGTVANGANAQCANCYAVRVGWSGTRPSLHWDSTFTERLMPDVLGQTKPWPLHVGQSFPDVPKTSLFYRDVETLLHKGITGGCTATQFCPGNPVTREQLAVFTLEGREGAGYRPPPCGTTPMFADVPSSSFFCGWIEELARRGVVGGCGGGNYCPAASVTREQMPVFVLRLLDPTLDPPACTTPLFADVPVSNPFCRWIEELARRGVVAGCGGGNYCPAAPVTRDQMAAFLVGTYALTLYGP